MQLLNYSLGYQCLSNGSITVDQSKSWRQTDTLALTSPVHFSLYGVGRR